MRKIKNYTLYLFESILYVEEDLVNILSKIKDSKIPDIILSMIDKDVKLNFNRLKLTDKNDMIEFLPDSKIKDVPNWTAKGNEAKVGRLIKDILTRNGHTEFTDKEIEQFVTQFKAAYDFSKMEDDKIRIVKGDDIKKWYLGTNYESDSGGTLNKSCMRYQSCQDYFGIYTENEDVCSLVIMLNEDGELIARALLWKLNYSNKKYEWYLDRVYYNREEQEDILSEWVRQRYTNLGEYSKAVGNVDVKLKNSDFDYYPYMDTFIKLDDDLLNNYDQGDKLLQNTDGTSNEGIYCEMEETTYPEDEVVFLDDRQVFCHQDNARYSEKQDQYYWYEDVKYSNHNGDYYLSDDCVWSEHLSDYLNNEDSFNVYLDLDKEDEDYYADDELGTKFAENGDTGEYYVIELLTKTYKGSYVLKEDAYLAYELIGGEGFYTKIDGLIYNKKLDFSKEVYFTKGEYYNELYSDKIYVKEYRFIDLRLADIDIDGDEKHDKLEDYSEWNDGKMHERDKYWALQKLYEYGGYQKFINSKRTFFLSEFNRLFSDPNTFSNCVLEAQKQNSRHNNRWSFKLNDYTVNSQSPIDKLSNLCKNEFFKLMNTSFTFRDMEHGPTLRKLLMSMKDLDMRSFFLFLLSEICSIFQADEDGEYSHHVPFLRWGNSKWVDFLKISSHITTQIIAIVDSRLKNTKP